MTKYFLIIFASNFAPTALFISKNYFSTTNTIFLSVSSFHSFGWCITNTKKRAGSAKFLTLLPLFNNDFIVLNIYLCLHEKLEEKSVKGLFI